MMHPRLINSNDVTLPSGVSSVGRGLWCRLRDMLSAVSYVTHKSPV
jgi:hypothetical protein